MTHQLIRFYRQIPTPFIVATPTAAAAYVGPGDVVGGAVAWWGLRAYTSATIGTSAVRLREDGGNTEQDFATIAGGGLDLAAITTFKGANNLFVAKVYDQVGTNHLVQATAGNQPQFILSGLGSLPVMRFVAATPLSMTTVNIVVQAQPFTISYTAKRTGNFSAYGSIFGGGALVLAGFANVADNAFIYAASAQNASALDSAFHAIQNVFNGASTDLNVDGSTNTVNPGTNGIVNDVISFGFDIFNDNAQADCVEMGYWGSAFSGANSTAMSANQHTYWGF